MKLNHLDSTTEHPTGESVARVRHAAQEPVRRVEALEGVAGDRTRSLQQEIAEVDPRAIGPFEGRDQVLQDARAVAARLTSLGAGAGVLIKVAPMPPGFTKVDDSA